MVGESRVGGADAREVRPQMVGALVLHGSHGVALFLEIVARGGPSVAVDDEQMAGEDASGDVWT